MADKLEQTLTVSWFNIPEQNKNIKLILGKWIINVCTNLTRH